MNTLNIVEFRPRGMGLFANFLTWLSSKKDWGWNIQNHPQFSWELLEGVQGAIVDSALSAEILGQVRTLPTLVRNLECLDSFFFEQGAWYPRILCYEALRQVLVSEARDLDIRAPAFVVGNTESIRVVASVLAEMGIVDIFLVGEVSLVQKQMSVLKHSHIGINFQIVDSEDLTLQSVSAGIIVNTIDLSERKALLTDLSYFNFMKPGGYVLDLNLLPQENLLLEEADKADLRVLRPVRVMAATTRLWLERFGKADGLGTSELVELWNEFLKESTS